ncbi:hypothetical protein AVEN_104766-1 [Araneus ventricosus]|uniref:Uncharacterized protein n=1 Tax=Araneus ventricosus TaxID=182803 RepID=A0A4Y2KEI3_ARAVE|nr:hypothetical protein AVEN_104766-1 [Araneus ventricosus]
MSRVILFSSSLIPTTIFSINALLSTCQCAFPLTNPIVKLLPVEDLPASHEILPKNRFATPMHPLCIFLQATSETGARMVGTGSFKDVAIVVW